MIFVVRSVVGDLCRVRHCMARVVCAFRSCSVFAFEVNGLPIGNMGDFLHVEDFSTQYVKDQFLVEPPDYKTLAFLVFPCSYDDVNLDEWDKAMAFLKNRGALEQDFFEIDDGSRLVCVKEDGSRISF